MNEEERKRKKKEDRNLGLNAKPKRSDNTVLVESTKNERLEKTVEDEYRTEDYNKLSKDRARIKVGDNGIKESQRPKSIADKFKFGLVSNRATTKERELGAMERALKKLKDTVGGS